MASFWLWKSDHSSPASFEKTLSTQVARISQTQAKLDYTLSKARRIRFLATLYLSFSYSVYVIVLVLVVGWQNVSPARLTVVAGGPVGIYIVRLILSAYYNFRIDSQTTQLKNYQAERAKTIQKLKDATKYDSTLQLLEKYGGSEKKHAQVDGKGILPSQRGASGTISKEKWNNGASPVMMRSSPTANTSSDTPENRQKFPSTTKSSEVLPSEEFAPNAFGPHDFMPVAESGSESRKGATTEAKTDDDLLAALSAARSPSHPGSIKARSSMGDSRWYDRILDLLMGEDETAAKNRFVLICSYCRLVNGRAPPGTLSCADLGQWRCMGCGMLNGDSAIAKGIARNVPQGQEHDTSLDDGDKAEDGDKISLNNSDIEGKHIENE